MVQETVRVPEVLDVNEAALSYPVTPTSHLKLIHKPPLTNNNHDNKVRIISRKSQLTKEGTSGNSVSKALSPLLQLGDKLCVVFVDEFDKLFISGNSNSSLAHETTTGVQNEFLKILEGKAASVYGDYGKYVNINMGNCLFVFAGAFNNELDLNVDRLREIGLKTEFLGRVSLVYNTEPLSLEDLFEILTESPLLAKYLELFTDISKEVVLGKLKAQIKANFDKNTLGARMIHTLVHEYFISRGKSSESRTKKVTFQRAMRFED